MTLRALRTLHAIVQHGSFARAGDAIGLTQSAVSLQVKALEEEFGVKLFDRSHRRPALTEAGKIVLARSQEVLTLYDRIPQSLNDERSLTGRLKVGAMPTALSGVLPDALVALNKTHPRVRVHLASGLSGDLVQQVTAGELDIAITLEPSRSQSAKLSWLPLYTDRFWLIAPANLDHMNQRKLLTEQPFIRLDRRALSSVPIDRELRRLRVSVREEMVLGSPEIIIKMVQKGLGISIVSISEDLRKELSLTCLPFGAPQLTRQIGFLVRRNRSDASLVRALADAVTEVTRFRR